METRFLKASAAYLEDTYLPRLERALETLPEGDLWWRPHSGALSFGTILRHLEGNVRQWLLSGVGALPDLRDRASEFTREGDTTGPELLAALRETVTSAAALIAGMDAERLAEPRTIQGLSTTVLEAVYHVVEHFSWHCGQAVWIAKARAGDRHGLAFYDDARINAAHNEDPS